jgi:hypothetical protein
LSKCFYIGLNIFSTYYEVVKEISNIKPNLKLTYKIGRRQFNFHSDNISNCTKEEINNYILMTNDLNSLKN